MLHVVWRQNKYNLERSRFSFILRLSVTRRFWLFWHPARFAARLDPWLSFECGTLGFEVSRVRNMADIHDGTNASMELVFVETQHAVAACRKPGGLAPSPAAASPDAAALAVGKHSERGA